MAYLDPRTKRLFYGEVLHCTAGRFRKRFKTKDLAEAYESHIRAHGEEPAWARGEGPERLDIHTFSKVYQELKEAGGPDGSWLAERDLPGARRRDWVASSTRLSHMDVRNIKYTDLEAFVTDLRKRPGKYEGERMSQQSIKHYLGVARGVLRYAAVKGYIQAPPPSPKIKVRKWHQPIFTDVMLDAAIGHLEHPEDRLAIRVLDVTGMRCGELYGLLPQQITDDGFIALDDPTKLKNEETGVVHVGEQLGRDLRAVIAAGGLSSYDTLHNRWEKALKMCGYKIPRPLHALRHTMATRTLAQTRDVHISQKVLRHRDIATTQRYLHLSVDMLKAEAKKLSHGRGESKPLGEVIDFPVQQNQ
jgi:integrase